MGDWSFHRHLILWTKGHYPSLGDDPVQAMSHIMARVSMTPLKYVRQVEAVQFIIEAALMYGKQSFAQGLARAVVQDRTLGYSNGMDDIMRVLVSHLRLIEVWGEHAQGGLILGPADLLTTTTLYEK